MTASIKHTLTLLEANFADLPRHDLAAFDDTALERLQVLAHQLTALHEQCLEQRHVRPRITVAGPVHPEVLRDAVRQGYGERN